MYVIHNNILLRVEIYITIGIDLVIKDFYEFYLLIKTEIDSLLQIS